MEWSEKRALLYEIIFEADTPAGKYFDVGLIAAILMSVLVVMLESVATIRMQNRILLRTTEWIFTILFTLEYVLRLVSARRPLAYALSFYGIVDLLAIVPTYLSLLFPGAQYFVVIRTLRILRVFRVLKLVKYVSEAAMLGRAIRASRRKIFVFIYSVFISVIIIGSLMYVVEGEENGFTSIPRSIYWAIVTLTTVGYGDVAPATTLGQTLAAFVMILGYGIIAVPTGIVTAELQRENIVQGSDHSCPDCGRDGHDADARHCKHCGKRLPS